MKILRHSVQVIFLLVVLGAVFIFKGNAEVWCPFGGLEAFYTYFYQGNMPCSLGVSNFYILAAVILLTLFVKRAFCSYMCPIGAVSEWLYMAGRRIKLPMLNLPAKIDGVLSMLKYVVAAVILFLTYQAGELIFRAVDPCYALISRHGEDITFWAYVVVGLVTISSLFFKLPFCRWLCPLGAVLNLFSRFGLTRIKRNIGTCTNCSQCAKACPSSIPVDKVEQVAHARCLSCFNCVDVCPEKDTLVWGPPNIIAKKWHKMTVVGAIFLFVGMAIAGYLLFPLPSFVQQRGKAPAQTKTVHLELKNLGCRGTATLLFYYLTRDDMAQIQGYLKLHAWPSPGYAKVSISYNPSLADEEEIKEAITEPYYDNVQHVWRNSPFEIKGYDSLQLDESIKSTDD